ncbi:MAG: hypothetical protein RBT11_00440 [Desulfobacterales bacterium]|jgi:hypothetical protein|nr:hypothetical protein [Desulfobacterales bacterium]
MNPWLVLILIFIFFQDAVADHIGPLEILPSLKAAPECRAPEIRQNNPCVAFGTSVYLVAWRDGARQPVEDAADIYCARIDPATGSSLDPDGILVCNAPNVQGYPSVSFDGKRFLIVWEDFRNGRDYDIYAAVVDEKGVVSKTNGMPVSTKSGNQARPSVSYGKGNYFVVWMDARNYPVYSLVGARVSDAGACIDPEGIFLDGESPDNIQKVLPENGKWLGDDEYWWADLNSRGNPSIACRGNECAVAYRIEAGKFGKTQAAMLALDPSSGKLLERPLVFEGSWVVDKPGIIGTVKGWGVAFNHWIGGWNCEPTLSFVEVRGKWPQRLTFAEKDKRGNLFFPHETLEKGYAVGKGQISPFQAAMAWSGKYALLSMEFGWRTADPPTPHSAILLNYYNPADDVSANKFMNKSLWLDKSEQRAGSSVANPALASGPNGECLLVYEKDTGLNSRFVLSRIIKGK